MSRITSKLKNKVEVLTKQKVKNKANKTIYEYKFLKTVYSQITNQKGDLQNGPAGTEYSEATHKIKIRIKSLPEIDNTYRFKYKDQIYEVKYIDPDFKNNEFYEIYTRLVIE